MAVQRFGRYRILREYGRDATAVVYLARDPNSGRQVAIQVLAEPYTAAPDFAERFAQVVERLAAAQHPCVLPVLDHGLEDGRYFLVSRYMAGGSLSDRLDGRPMLLADVMPLLQRLADALDAVHAAGLVHGNLNPDSVLFDIHGHGYLAGTSVAPLLYAGEAHGGWEGLVVPAYMSPEQAAGGPIDGRSDVYALGLLLFEMLTGRQPFEADTAADLARAHREAPVPQLSAAALQHLVLPEDFNQVMARALAKRPEVRYPTAGVLAEAVRNMFVAAAPEIVPEAEPPPVETVAAAASAAAAGAAPAEAAEPEAAEPAAAESALTEPAVAEPAAVEDAAAEAEEQAAPTPAAEVAASEAAPAPESEPAPALALGDEPPEVTEFERTGEPAPAAGGRRLGALEWGGIGLIMLFFAFFLLRDSDFIAGLLPPTATPTLTATITPSFTLVPSRTPAPTATGSPTPTFTPAPTDTPTRTRTPRPSATRTASPSPSATATNVPATLPLFTPTLAPANTVEVPLATDTSEPPPPPPPPPPPEPTTVSEASPSNTPSLTTPPAPPGP